MATGLYKSSAIPVFSPPFDYIKGQEGRKQQLRHRLPGIPHIHRSHQVIPEHHHRHLAAPSAKQPSQGAGQPALFPIDIGGGAGEGAAGDDVHQAAPDAGAADGEHLRDGHDDADGQGGQGAEEQAADDDDDVLGIVLQEQDQRDAAKDGGDVGQRAQQAQGGQFLSACVFHTDTS